MINSRRAFPGENSVKRKMRENNKTHSQYIPPILSMTFLSPRCSPAPSEPIDTELTSTEPNPLSSISFDN